MKQRARVFVGCSTESLDVAEAIQYNLDYSADVTIWTQGVFQSNSTAIEKLAENLRKYDFAIFVLSPDDLLLSRGEQKAVVRDNVLFEMGLFVGRLGRARSFFVAPRSRLDLQVPSDLLDVTIETYQEHSDGNLIASLGRFCTGVKTAIRTEGPLPGLDSDNLQVLVNQIENYMQRDFARARIDTTVPQDLSAQIDPAPALGEQPFNKLLLEMVNDNIIKLGARTLLLIAMHFFGKHQYEEAVAFMAHAIKADPDNSYLHSYKAGSLKKLGKWPEAAAECKLALVLNSENADAHYNLACFYAVKGDLGNMTHHAAEAVRIKDFFRDYIARAPYFKGHDLTAVLKTGSPLRAKAHKTV